MAGLADDELDELTPYYSDEEDLARRGGAASPNVASPSVSSPSIGSPTRPDTTTAAAMPAVKFTPHSVSAQPSAIDKQAAADAAELGRVQTTGSGISQVQHGSPTGGIGIQKPHPILGGALRALDTLGSVVAPWAMVAVPGTTLHHQAELGRSRRSLAEDVEEQGKEAQVGEAGARADQAEAEAQKALADAARPKVGSTPEETTLHDLMTGDNGSPRVNPDTGKPYQYLEAFQKVYQAKQDTKPEPVKPAHINYDSGIPVSVTNAKGEVFDVNDPKLPEELKPLVQSATKAHGQHIKEAADTQAQAAANANSRQSKAEEFQQQEKGREHITKIEGDYTDAASKADLIRDAIRQAQAGNKMAASFQGMLATLGITTMEGVKRINAVELGIPTGAGSLWDRVVNKLGKWTAGQPMDSALQKDLLSLADTIQNASYKKYKAQHDKITKRYSLTDEEAMPGPAGAEAGSGEPQRPANVPANYVYQKNGPKGEGWYRP